MHLTVRCEATRTICSPRLLCGFAYVANPNETQTALDVLNAYIADWQLLKRTIERLSDECADAKAVIEDLALIHDVGASRDLDALIIAAREWLRVYHG
jgi:hypothetical protein